MSEKGKSLLQEAENLHAKVQRLKLASKRHPRPTDGFRCLLSWRRLSCCILTFSSISPLMAGSGSGPERKRNGSSDWKDLLPFPALCDHDKDLLCEVSLNSSPFIASPALLQSTGMSGRSIIHTVHSLGEGAAPFQPEY